MPGIVKRTDGVLVCLPIRDKTSIAVYVGKYLAAGFMVRKHSWKGCRRGEYDRRSARVWKRCSRIFAWVSPSAMKWQRRVGELGGALGLRDYLQLRQKLGRKWAYELRETIMTADENAWRDFLTVNCRLPFRQVPAHRSHKPSP